MSPVDREAIINRNLAVGGGLYARNLDLPAIAAGKNGWNLNLIGPLHFPSALHYEQKAGSGSLEIRGRSNKHQLVLAGYQFPEAEPKLSVVFLRHTQDARGRLPISGLTGQRTMKLFLPTKAVGFESFNTPDMAEILKELIRDMKDVRKMAFRELATRYRQHISSLPEDLRVLLLG